MDVDFSSMDDDGDEDFDMAGSAIDFEGVDPELNQALGLGAVDGLSTGDAIASFAAGAVGWDPEELARKLAETEDETQCLTGCNLRL
jgi:hypothetical protein